MGIFSVFTGGNAKRASLAAQQQIAAAKAESQGQLQQGFNTAKDYLTQAGAQYDPFTKYASNYNDLYAGGVGANGAAGSASAWNAFTNNNPGYQFALDQGLQGINRAAAAGGNLASGNTLAAAAGYGTNLANQYYQQWLDNLRSGMSSSFAGAQGKAGTLGQIGGYGYQLGQDKAGITNKAAGDIAGLIGGASAAKTQGGANLIGAGLSLAQSLAGGGGGFGNIFKLFGGGGDPTTQPTSFRIGTLY